MTVLLNQYIMQSYEKLDAEASTYQCFLLLTGKQQDVKKVIGGSGHTSTPELFKHQDIPNNFDNGYIYYSLLYVTSRCPKLRDFKLHSFSILKFTRQKKLTCSSHRV
jgi:hypothetical protein